MLDSTNKSKLNNIIFLAVIALLLIPQTRKPFQVLLHKGIALVNPVSIKDESERVVLNNYDWKFQKEDGTQYNFNKVKGKVIVINFWATWCPPCIAEMPSLQKLYSKYGDEVEFLFVTSDPIEKIRVFKNKNDYTFPVYQIISNPPEVLETTSIPRTLVVNQQGELIIDKSGAVDWFSDKIRKTLDSFLKKTT